MGLLLGFLLYLTVFFWGCLVFHAFDISLSAFAALALCLSLLPYPFSFRLYAFA